MSVIKMYELSEIKEIEEIRKKVIERQKANEYFTYTPENIMLIRATNVFPQNREIVPLSDSTLLTKTSQNFIRLAYEYQLEESVLEQLETYVPHYRSTIHFTENGLVSSHSYGNFENRDFIILEPLVEQLGKSDIKNFAGQDTFVQGKVVLSERSIIIIRKDRYEQLKQLYPEIEEYNIVLFNGLDENFRKLYLQENEEDIFAQFKSNDERAIVEQVLLDLGYTPELIGTHYITESPSSKNIRVVNKQLAEKYNVVAEGKHHHSEEYQEDIKINCLLINIFDKLLFDFIIRKHDFNSNIFMEKTMREKAYTLVDLIGLEEVIKDIESFNSTIESMKQLNLFPKSNEIINGKIPDVFDFYEQNLKNNR